MNTARLNALIAAVKLAGVRFVETSATTRIRNPEEAADVLINVMRDISVSAPPSGGRFYVLASVVANVEQKGSDNPLVSVSATFELAYELPEVFDVGEEDLKSFAQTNGVFNVWPYWREFLQSTLQRMELPPIVLPLLTMKQIVSRLAREQSAQPNVADVQQAAS